MYKYMGYITYKFPSIAYFYIFNKINTVHKSTIIIIIVYLFDTS